MTDRNRNRAQITANATAAALTPGLQRVSSGNAGMDRWIGDVTQRLEVGAGRRSPFDKWVTKRELHEELQSLGLIATQNPQNATTRGGVAVLGPNGVQQVVPYDVFAESIRNTKLFRDLDRRIDDPSRFDDLPARVREILLADLTPLRGQVDASIREIKEISKSATEAQAIFGNEIRAQVQQAAAGVRQVSAASASANRATAAVVTTVQARLDNFTGGAPGSATVEEKMTAIADRATGLEAQWTVKVAAGGAMAGIGAAATENTEGQITSHVIVMAQNFAVVDPDDTLSGTGTVGDPYTAPANRVPFGVDAVNNTVYVAGTLRVGSGTGPRVDAVGKRIVLTAPTDTFIVSRAGTATPTSVVITATRLNELTGTTTWSVVDGTATLTSTSDTSATLTYANLTTDTATIQASVTMDSVTYTAQITIRKTQLGTRGAVTAYGLNFGISSGSWSDNEANRVIKNIALGETSTTGTTDTSYNRVRDTVTLSNGSSFSATKYWNGSAWTTATAYIDGDLLVAGTVTADAVAVSTDIIVEGAGEFNGSSTVGGNAAAVHANDSGNALFGVVGWGTTTVGSIGVYGIATTRTGTAGLATSGIGVLGSASTGIAVEGVATSSGGIGGWFAGSASTECAIRVDTGYVREPTGNYSTGAATATFSGTNKPGSNTSNEWVVHYKGTTKGWIPWWPDA